MPSLKGLAYFSRFTQGFRPGLKAVPPLRGWIVRHRFAWPTQNEFSCRLLSRANLDLNSANFGRARRLRWLEVELQRFFQVGEGLFFGLTLAGDIDL